MLICGNDVGGEGSSALLSQVQGMGLACETQDDVARLDLKNLRLARTLAGLHNVNGPILTLKECGLADDAT